LSGVKKSYVGFCPDCGTKHSLLNLPKGTGTKASNKEQTVNETNKGQTVNQTTKEQTTEVTREVEEPEGDEGEIKEETKEPERVEVPTTKKEIADDFGVWRRIYIPYDVCFAFNRVKSDGLTDAKDLQSWLVECVDLALEYAYRRRIVFEQVLSKDGKLKWIKDQGFTKEQLEGLLKIGSITEEEFNTLVGGE